MCVLFFMPVRAGQGGRTLAVANGEAKREVGANIEKVKQIEDNR